MGISCILLAFRVVLWAGYTGDWSVEGEGHMGRGTSVCVSQTGRLEGRQAGRQGLLSSRVGE